MTRTGYVVAMVALFGGYVAWMALWQDQLFDNWLLNAGSLAVLLLGGGALTMVRKRSAQASDRSREPDSIERRASERASEQAFEVALVLIVAQAALLAFAWGAMGFLAGAAALVLAVGAFWMLYRLQLRKVTRHAEQDS